MINELTDRRVVSVTHNRAKENAMKYTGESTGLYGEAPEAILNGKQEHESEERHLMQTRQFYE